MDVAAQELAGVQIANRLSLTLWGPLSLRDASGADLTPRARKAQGLLALVGTSPGLKRSRSWLQDKLWSDRGPEQGAASLRQCLTEIRGMLGRHVDCLVTEGGWIALDPGKVAVVREPPRDDPTAEFLEGLDVRDPEFEDWLRDERLARERAVPAQPAPPRRGPDAPSGPPDDHRPLLVLSPAEAASEDLRLVAATLTDGIGLQVAQAGNAQVVEAMPPDLGRRPVGLRIAVRTLELGNMLYLQIRLADLALGTVHWIGLKELDPKALKSLHHGPIAQAANEAAAVAIDEFGRLAAHLTDEDRLALLGYQSLRHTVLLDPEEQRKADQMLEAAFRRDPRGVYLARRALLRVVQVVERMTLREDVAVEEAVALVRQAQDLDPLNPTVTAAASRVAVILEGRVEGGLELAQRAVAQGPANPLAWDSLAGALVRSGQAAEAHRAALRARELVSSLPQTYLWDMLCCITATVSGQYAEAIRYGRIARDLAPTFKPPLRYLAALYYHQGDEGEARRQLETLKALETDFTLEKLQDRSYPVASMRQTPLIRLAKSGLL
jgi:tetratricopeptide (TPR) repeat protein